MRAHGYDILCFIQDADEFVAEILGEYQGKRFCNVASQDLGLETDEEKAQAEKAQEENRELLEFVQKAVDGRVEAVKATRKLKSHAVCLSSEGEITLEMERYFHGMPGVDPKAMRARRVLELNLEHPAVRAMDQARNTDPQRAEAMARVLLAQAELMAGFPPEDPSAYSELVCTLF